MFATFSINNVVGRLNKSVENRTKTASQVLGDFGGDIDFNLY